MCTFCAVFGMAYTCYKSSRGKSVNFDDSDMSDDLEEIGTLFNYSKKKIEGKKIDPRSQICLICLNEFDDDEIVRRLQ